MHRHMLEVQPRTHQLVRLWMKFISAAERAPSSTSEALIALVPGQTLLVAALTEEPPSDFAYAPFEAITPEFVHSQETYLHNVVFGTISFVYLAIIWSLFGR
jgi:hypothetical protein